MRESEKWFVWHSQIHRWFKRASFPGVSRSSMTGSMTCGTCSPRYACIATDPLQIRHLADGQELWLLLHFFARLLKMQLHGVRGRGRRAGGCTFRLAVIFVIHVKLDSATLAVFLQDVAPTVSAGQRGGVANADHASNRRQIAGAPRERHSASVLASNVVQCRVDVFYSALHVRALKPQAVQLLLDLGHLGINVYGRSAALLFNVISGELPPGEDGRDWGPSLFLAVVELPRSTSGKKTLRAPGTSL